jgi:hypothetical protein
VNCWVAPGAMLAVAGETAIDVTVRDAAVTVSVSVPVNPSAVALMVVVPAPTPVAVPVELTVATTVFDETQVTEDVRFAVDPSL